VDGIISVMPWLAPTISALAVLVQNIGSRRSVFRRLDWMERTLQMLLMHDTHLPLSMRVDAGKRYVDLDGNGSQKAYYERLTKMYQERLEKDMEGKTVKGDRKEGAYE